MANHRHLEILDKGVETWNNWRKDNTDVKPNLSSADLRSVHLTGADLSSADLSSAILIKANLSSAILIKANLSSADLIEADFRRAHLSGADLSSVNLRDAILNGANLSSVNLRDAILNGANLSSADLIEADFRRAHLSGANLSGAQLEDANLNNARLIRADLTNANLNGATLTGACIKDWNINSATNLKDVICDYVYLKSKRNQETRKYDLLERRPSDPNKTFAPGEFIKLVEKARETVDLIFEHGIDWKAFLPTLQDLQVKHQDEDLSIAAIEKKPDGAFVVRLNISSYGDEKLKGLIEREAKQWYEEKLKLIEAQYHQQLQAKDNEITIYKQQSADILELAKLAANRPIHIETKAISNSKAMNESIDKSRNLQVGDVGGDFKPIGSPIMSDNVEISGTVAESINQLPSSSDPNQPGIKELLSQLNEAINNSPELNDKDKAEALEQLKVLAKAGQKPTDEESKTIANTAMKILRGTAAILPAGAALVTICKEVLPAIAKLFGL